MTWGWRTILYEVCALFLILAVGFAALHIWLVLRDKPQARGPYLQSVTPDSVWVVWDTPKPSTGKVEYGLTPSLGQSVEAQGDSLHHELQLARLKPYTTYYYRVDGGETAAFRTAAGPDQTAFRFAVFGDTRSNTAIHRAIVGQMVNNAPDFVIHTGDLVESGRANTA